MKRGKILIVDDNEDILFTLKMLLRPLVESITMTTDPRELLPLISRTHFNVILLALSKIIDKGALERFFRNEGRMRDNVKALAIDSRKLRLYCLRISDQVLILGNGGVKTTRTYQENEKLSGYVMDLQTFDKVLVKAQKTGKITIEKNMITDIESATFEI